MMIKLKNHPDGDWLTTEYPYKGRILIIKSKQHHGMKLHSMLNGKCEFTLRYHWVNPKFLLEKAKKKIDKLQVEIKLENDRS